MEEAVRAEGEKHIERSLKVLIWVEQREDRKADESMRVNKWAELYKALK